MMSHATGSRARLVGANINGILLFTVAGFMSAGSTFEQLHGFGQHDQNGCATVDGWLCILGPLQV